RVHVGVLVGLAGDGRLEVIGSAADGQARRRVAGLLEVFEVAVRVAGLTLGGGAKHGGHVVVTLDVGLRGEVQVATVGLRFAGKRFFQVQLGFAAFKFHH